MGPYGLGWVHSGEATDFLATLGLVFLMFLSGLDTSLNVLKEAKKDVLYFTVFNFCVPLFTGFSLGFLSGMGFLTSAQMSTTLPTASIGLQYGVFKEGVLASLVVLSIASIVVAPFLAEWSLGVKVEKPSKFERFWRGKNVEETT